MFFAMRVRWGARAFLRTALLACAAAPTTTAADLEGHWVGEWRRNGAALSVEMDFASHDGVLEGSFDSEGLRVVGIPLGDVRVSASDATWKIVGDATTTTFHGRVEGDTLEGGFNEDGTEGQFRFVRSAPPPRLHEESLAFRSGPATLSGTLVLPAESGRPFPSVVFLHGSGPEGRWASKYLATHFAREGVAALIYDKRGVGKSTGDLKSAGFEELVEDAAAAITALRSDPRIDRNRIGIHGHSQGATYAPWVAERAGTVAFIVCSSGSGVPMDEVERYSVGNSVGLSQLPPEEAKEARAFVDALVETAYHGTPRARLVAAWQRIKDRPWAFPLPGDEDSYWSFSRKIATYDPLAHWKEVAAPTLLVFGERDERIPASRSAALIAQALLSGRGRDITAKIFPGADHNFRRPDVPGEPRPWPASVAGYPDIMVQWVKRVVFSAGT
jgi:uncharacterized protein